MATAEVKSLIDDLLYDINRMSEVVDDELSERTELEMECDILVSALREIMNTSGPSYGAEMGMIAKRALQSTGYEE